MAKQVDLKAAKERKQKKIAAVGGVLLVVVLFVQVPRTLSMMNGDEETAAAAPAATAPAAATPAPATSAPVPQPEVVTASLVSFSRFESKDPFVQQVKEESGSLPGEAPADSTGGGSAEEPDGSITEPDDETGPSEPTAFTQAEIEVNGVAELLRADSPFPAANPMFLLVSISKKSVGIKVADGGTFASGDPTLTLTLGKPVTLVNTADGTRFVLKLKGVS